MPPINQLYLKPEEGKFLAMAVVNAIDTLKETATNVKINWTPESRKTLREMIEAGEKLSVKLEKLGFDMRPLPPFEDGDEEEFLTKLS